MRANIKFGIILGIMIALLLLGGGLVAFVRFNEDAARELTATYLGGEVVTQKTGDGKSEITKVSEGVAVTGEGGETVVNATVEQKPASSGEDKEKNDLKTFARSFTERFGSFSNQNDFENIRNVMIYMTPEMEEWSEEFIAKEKKDARPGAYYGITTKVLNMEITEFESDKASAKVSTQRKETAGVPQQTRTFSQSAEVRFEKSGGAWKVDEFNWL